MSSDDVGFYWSIMALDLEVAEEAILLTMLVQHWVTVRGFSFTGVYLEL